MDLPDTVILDVPNLLTAAGVFVALLAAVYSARSAVAAHRQAVAAETSLSEAKIQSAAAKEAVAEARSQNRIAIHAQRLASYKALLAFRSQLMAQGVHYKEHHLWGLWEQVQLSEFYFSAAVATELNSIVDLALDVQHVRSLWKDTAEVVGEERTQLVNQSYELFTQLHERIKAIDPLMRQELKLVEG